jgi:uncharacterized membrane protein
MAWRRTVGEHRFLWLFLFLLAYVAGYPYTESSGVGTYVFRGLGAAVIVASLFAVNLRRGLALVALILAIPAMVQHVMLPSAAAGFLPIVNVLLTLGFDLWIIVAIFRRVFSHIDITSETISGALCIYLLNGLTFASVYGLVRDLRPGAFALDPVMQHAHPTRFDLIYYSFGMMTQLGAAGMTAATDQVRSLSLLEAILGQLYLAVMIARLISAYRLRSDRKTS